MYNYLVDLRIDIIMILLVLYLMVKTYPRMKDGRSHHAYFLLLHNGLFFTVTFFFFDLFVGMHLTSSPALCTVLVMLYFVGLCLSTFGWVTYSEVTVNAPWIDRPRMHLLLGTPLLLYMLAIFTTPWTHLMFYFTPDCVYQRGWAGGILQFVVPGLYLVGLCLRQRKALRSLDRADAYQRGILFFPAVHVVAIVLQLLFSGPYIVMATVASLLVSYIELHSVEQNRIDQADARARDAHRHFLLIGALSSDFEDVFLLNPMTRMSQTFKVRGQLVDEDKMRERPYAEAYNYHIEKYVHPDDRERVRSRYEFANVMEQLGQSGHYSFSYRVIYHDEVHHYMVRFSKVSDDGEDAGRIIFGHQCIDELVRMQHNSYSDNLTGLQNRHAYNERLEKMTAEGLSDDLVVVSYDVNGLKPINDTLGHAAGDELLVGAATCLRGAWEGIGDVYRMGGDEFLVLAVVDAASLPGVLADAHRRLGAWEGQMVRHLSAACGYATRSERPGSSPRELAVLADMRMYEDKARHYAEKRRQ